MPWYLYIALRQLFPSGRKFPFFTAISVLGVALGVMILVLTTSVMAGFGYETRRMIVETQGDIRVVPNPQFGNKAIANARAVQEAIGRVPGVVASTPYLEGMAMLQFKDQPTFPVIHGIDADQVSAVIPFDKYVGPGSLSDLDDDSIILSTQLAYGIGARIGSKVEVTSPTILEKIPAGEVYLPRELKVVGMFEIGHQLLDSSLVIMTKRGMQDLWNLGTSVHGIAVKIAPDADADEVARRIDAALPQELGLHARSWMDSNKDFLFVLQLEHNMIFFLLLFIVVVAAFSVTSSLLISVVRKTREIGLFGALGAEPRDVALCFCFQGLFIGVVGTMVGLGLGFGALWLRNDVVRFFTKITQSEEVMRRFYQFSQLPSHTTQSDIVAIVVCSVVISTMAGIIPAWRAARLRPVEALRSE